MIHGNARMVIKSVQSAEYSPIDVVQKSVLGFEQFEKSAGSSKILFIGQIKGKNEDNVIFNNVLACKCGESSFAIYQKEPSKSWFKADLYDEAPISTIEAFAIIAQNLPEPTSPLAIQEASKPLPPQTAEQFQEALKNTMPVISSEAFQTIQSISEGKFDKVLDLIPKCDPATISFAMAHALVARREDLFLEWSKLNYDPNFNDFSLWASDTLLTLAINLRLPHILNKLLDDRADVNFKGSLGDTPLDYAVSSHPQIRGKVITELLDRGAIPTQLNLEKAKQEEVSEDILQRMRSMIPADEERLKK